MLLHENTVEQPNRMTVELCIFLFIIVACIAAVRHPYFIHKSVKILQGHILALSGKQAFYCYAFIA